MNIPIRTLYRPARCRPLLITWSFVFLPVLPAARTLQAEPIEVASPGKVLKLAFELEDGAPTYRVSRLGTAESGGVIVIVRRPSGASSS